MRKLFILLAFLSVFISCPGFASERIKIGFLLKTMQEERYETDKATFLAKAKELGAIPLFDSCHNDEMEQVLRFENMLDNGVKVIVLQPVNTETAAILVEMAHQKGVRVVGYDSLPMNSPLDVMVMQDSWAVGKLQAEALVKWLRGRKAGKTEGKVEGKVALIMGEPGDSNANLMSEGAVQVLENNKGLEIVLQEAHEEWDPVGAEKTTKNVLAKFGNQVDGFICNNDGLATGVIAALKEKGLDNVDRMFVAGADADLVNIRYIVEGRQSVDVWKMIRPLAETAAEVAVKLARNPEKKVSELIKPDRMVNNGLFDIPAMVTPVKLVTRGNINQTLIQGGVYTWEQVYGGEPIPDKP
jgi:D-xylose transport system substrate-binding protein